MENNYYIKLMFSLPNKIKHIDNLVTILSRNSYLSVDTEACVDSISKYMLEKQKLIDKFHKLNKCYLNLDKKLVDCVNMRFCYHYSIEEIAEELKISEPTIMRRICTVNKKLSELLNKGESYGKL